MAAGTLATMMLGKAQRTAQNVSLGPAPTNAGASLTSGALLGKKKPGKKNPALMALGAATPKATGIFGF